MKPADLHVVDADLAEAIAPNQQIAAVQRIRLFRRSPRLDDQLAWCRFRRRLLRRRKLVLWVARVLREAEKPHGGFDLRRENNRHGIACGTLDSLAAQQIHRLREARAKLVDQPNAPDLEMRPGVFLAVTISCASAASRQMHAPGGRARAQPC